MEAFSPSGNQRVRHPSRAKKGLAYGRPVLPGFLVLLATLIPCPLGATADDRFEELILPILEDNCSNCHGFGINKGEIALDDFEPDDPRLTDLDLWEAVLRNVRAGIMPPADEPQPTAEELRHLEDWIKYDVFAIDPQNPDPGRVTVRRLNRIEYRNTIRDLIGVNFDTTSEFPADDTGHGFDNIGDVLTISPLLLEKYLDAAKAIVAEAVPTSSGVVAESRVPGQRFRSENDDESREFRDSGQRFRPNNARGVRGGEGGAGGPLALSYYEPAKVSTTVHAEHDGDYQLVLDLTASERYVDGVFDYNQCRLVFQVDGETLLDEEYSRQGGKPYRYEFDLDWKAGDHDLTFELQPLTPDEEQVRSLTMRINAVTVRGPMDEQFWTQPPNYGRFFPRAVPEDQAERHAYASELLREFAVRAFRRPVDDETVDRLATLADLIANQDEQTFEAGVAQAMTAVLASPRFLFREEGIEPGSTEAYPSVDEYALASRLSYFFWSSMPDEELFRLAETNQLRANLSAQVERMLADPRSEEFIRHFVGQWLHARDIESVLVNAAAVLSRDEVPDPEAERQRERFRELRRKPPDTLTEQEQAELEEARASFFGSFRRFRQFDLDRELRQAMRRETEMLFEHIVREDRSLLELLDSDYTFLNERLARHYGIEGVEGDEMRLVPLPPESPRGGVLTQGTVLAVTSNPDRTSPVKRGLFILENILGTPPAPPPPDIPSLEEAGKEFGDRVPTLRETLELHRDQPLCNSCHSRMDPLGLAFENFNALGLWRDQEREDPIDPTGQLITGESFKNVQELKQLLVNERRRDFYRCVSEKLLTYALGRGLDHHDVHTVDELVELLEQSNGRASALLEGVVTSTPFQKRRRLTESALDTAEAHPSKNPGKDHRAE